MRSVTSKRWATSLALIASLASCTSGSRQLHGTHEDLPGGNVVQMNLMTPTFGWVVTDRRFVSTKDAGKTWNDLTPVDAPGNTIKGAFFFDQKRVWCAALFNGTIDIYRSDTGGRSWRKTALPGKYTPVGSVFIDLSDPGHGWVAVDQPDRASPDLYLSTDNGVSWIQTTSASERASFEGQRATYARHPAVAGFDLLSFADATHGWARSTADRKLYTSTDGGKDWTKLQP